MKPLFLPACINKLVAQQYRGFTGCLCTHIQLVSDLKQFVQTTPLYKLISHYTAATFQKINQKQDLVT
jgi:hypothetical protein